MLCGGAGSGKTVLSSQIGAAYVRDGADAVWVRFDRKDTGVAQVWSRILTALVEAKIVSTTPAAQRILRGAPSTVTQAGIAESLAGLTTRLLIIVDDAPEINATEVVDSLLTALEASAHLSFLLTSRYAERALARARLRVPVNEIGGSALSLTRQQVSGLVALRAPKVDPERQAELADLIHTQSGGWPLAAHALAVESEARDTDQLFRGAGQFVPELVERLLQGCSPEQRLIVYVSALFDEVSEEALAHIVGIPQQTVSRLLGGLTEASLVHWRDESGTSWYRHHSLTHEELQLRARQEIDPDKLHEIHSRAAVAFRETRPRVAMQSAIDSEQWELLSVMLIRSAATSLRRDRPAAGLSSVPGSVREQFPIISMFALLDAYAYPTGRRKSAISGFRSLSDEPFAHESEPAGPRAMTAIVLRMITARLSGNEVLAAEMADRAQAMLQQLTDHDISTHSEALDMGITQIAITLMYLGRFEEAERMLEPMLREGALTHPKNRLHAMALTAWFRAWRGAKREADELIVSCARCTEPEGWQDTYVGAGYRMAAAIQQLEAGRPDDAEAHLLKLNEYGATLEHWPFLLTLRTLIVESRRGPVEALNVLSQELSSRRSQTADLPSATRMLNGLQARLQWQSGQVIARPADYDNSDIANIIGELSRGEYVNAEALAATQLRSADLGGRPRNRSELALLQADAARRAGNLGTAVEAAQFASHVMSDHGLTLPMRTMPRDAALSLAEVVPSLPAEHSMQVSVRDVRPLTPSEQRTLLGVAEHGSINRAADALFLSPDTVKGHLKQVYKKLGVNQRSDALRVAAEAGLLAELN